MKEVIKNYLKIVKAFIKRDVYISIEVIGEYYMEIRVTHRDFRLYIGIAPDYITVVDSINARNEDDIQWIYRKDLNKYLKTWED